jgi:putative PEP-CTERM system histidine kinase
MEHLQGGLPLSLASAVLLAGLCSLLLLRRRSASDLLLAALFFVLALMEIFDRFSLEEMVDPGRHKGVVLFLKSLIPLLALPYSLLFARERPAGAAGRLWLMLTAAGIAFPVAVVLLPAEQFYQWDGFSETGLVALGRTGYWFYLGIMLYCIAALVNLEATFGGSSGVGRWKIKYEFFGAVTLLGMLVFYLSQGLLYNSVNMNLLPIRSGVFIIGAVFVGYSRLARGGGARIAVSRYIAYRSFTLLVVGLYLVVLGALGSGIRYFHLPFGEQARTFVLIVSAILLLVVLFSEQVRRRVKVFVNKHFYAQKYDYRQEWLRFSEKLSLCRSVRDVNEVIVQTYSSVFGIEGTALYLHERKGNRLALAAVERESDLPEEFPTSAGLRRYFLESNRVLNARDAEYRPTAEEAGFLERSGAWLAVPIVSPGYLEGVVLFRQRLVREELTYEDYDMMKTLARQAGLSLMGYRLSAELTEAGEMAAIAKVSSFVVHDLKNVAYTFSLMLENAEKYIGEEDFQRDLLKSIQNTVAKMNGLIMKLKAFPKMEAPRSEAVDLAHVAAETARQFSGLKPGVNLLVETREARSSGDAAEIGKVVLNLILNAADAVGDRGEIRVSTGVQDGLPYARVEDNGSGMNEYFLKNHLFRPFRTTKEGGLGIGLYQCSQIAESHGGRIDVTSQVGKGSTFTLYLPAGCP